jgi:hypothetical protein
MTPRRRRRRMMTRRRRGVKTGRRDRRGTRMVWGCTMRGWG